MEICHDVNAHMAAKINVIVKEENHQGASGEPEIEYWQAAFSAVVAVPGADLGNMEGRDSIIELFACGGLPKVAGGAPVVALSEVMSGQKESACVMCKSASDNSNSVHMVKDGKRVKVEEWCVPEDRALYIL